jgi:hypothetical protein
LIFFCQFPSLAINSPRSSCSSHLSFRLL